MYKEVPDVLAALEKTDPDIAPELAKLSPDIVSGIWNDRKITAHHAIIPTRQPFNIGALSDNELKVYRLIRQHYLAQFFTRSGAGCHRGHFSCCGAVVWNAGGEWRLSGDGVRFLCQIRRERKRMLQTMSRRCPFPYWQKGDECRPAEAELKEMQTTPPRHYTEGTLIAAMKNAAGMVSDPALKKVLRENAGLGTEATRAEILETLFTRKYIEKQGKHIRATQLGGRS